MVVIKHSGYDDYREMKKIIEENKKSIIKIETGNNEIKLKLYKILKKIQNEIIETGNIQMKIMKPDTILKNLKRWSTERSPPKTGTV